MRFSSLDMLFACPGHTSISVDKEAAAEEFPNAKTSADWGTMVHNWKETGDIVHPSGDKREEKLLGNRIWSQKQKNKPLLNRYDYWPLWAYHEINVAYNWKYHFGTISIGKDPTWYTRFDDDWVVGKTDTVFENETGTLEIDDLKTGKWWDKRPLESMQITGYVTGVLTSAQFEEYADNALARVTHWPKYPAKDPPKVMKDPILPETLVQFGKTLESKMLARGEEFNPSVDNCRFCPGRFNCILAIKHEEDYTTKWRK